MRGTEFANTGNAQEDAIPDYQNDNNIIYLFPDSDASSSPNKYDELFFNNSDDDHKSDNEFDKMPRYLNIKSGNEYDNIGQSGNGYDYIRQSGNEYDYIGQSGNRAMNMTTSGNGDIRGGGSSDEENNCYTSSSYANSSYNFPNNSYILKNDLDEILKTDMTIEALCPEIKHEQRENNVFFSDNTKLSRTAEIVICSP